MDVAFALRARAPLKYAKGDGIEGVRRVKGDARARGTETRSRAREKARSTSTREDARDVNDGEWNGEMTSDVDVDHSARSRGMSEMRAREMMFGSAEATRDASSGVFAQEIARRFVASLGMMVFVRAGLLLPSRFFASTAGYDSPFSMRAVVSSMTGARGGLLASAFGESAGTTAMSGASWVADSMNANGVPWFHIGIGPYVGASIAMSVLVSLIPDLQTMRKDEMGMETLKWWTRLLTCTLAMIQSVIEAVKLQAFSLIGGGFTYYLYVVPMLVTGALALTWVADEISDYGFGQGSSVIILMSICSAYFSALSTLIPKITANGFSFVGTLPLIIFFSALLLGTVLLEQGTAKVPLQYFQGPSGSAGNLPRSINGKDGEDHIPFKINPSSMQPVIFAMFFIQALQFIPYGFSWCNGRSIAYFVLFFVLVFFGTYIDLQNTPQDISEYLMKIGARVPNVRPGESTVTYFSKVQAGSRFYGGLILAVIATTCSVADLWMSKITGNSFGLTSMLIVVSTIIGIKRQVQAMQQMPKIDRVLKSM